MNLNKRYCCIYLPHNDDNIYFELIIHNKDMNEIISNINKELNINFKIHKSYLDDHLGILFQDNISNKNENIDVVSGNLLFICHYANLEKYVKFNSYLYNRSNNDIILDLCRNFILFKNIK